MRSTNHQHYFVTVANHRIRVHRWGRGSQLLVALHGFGRSGMRFDELGYALADKYTLCAPDLPFHGGTEWKEEVFRRADWQRVVMAISQHEGREQFHLLGHSFGGRIALRMLPTLPHQLLSLMLVAPDGLGGHYTGWVDRVPTLLHRRLLRLIDSPERLLGWVEHLYRQQWINPYALRYIEQQLTDQALRRRLRGVWSSLPYLQLKRRQLFPVLETLSIPVVVWLDENDPVVNSRRVARWFAQVPTVDLRWHRSGHQLPGRSLVATYRSWVE